MPVEQEHVAEDSEDGVRDRDHQRLRVTRRERVQRVRDDRGGRDDGDELVDHGERVAVQHLPARCRLLLHERELATPLAEREEQRQQARAEEEPG